MLTLSLAAMVSCGNKSIDDQAEQDAEEYNEKFCPTPVVNYSRTDSVSYDRKTRTYTFYCSLVDKADNEELINAQAQFYDALCLIAYAATLSKSKKMTLK